MKLTPKQKKFADEYIKTGNATQSAIEAGYSKKTARSVGSENLTKPDISEYIAKRLEKIDKEKIAEQKEILEFMTRVMRRQETEQVTNVLKKPTVLTVHGSGDDNTYEKVVNEEVVEVSEVAGSVGDAVRAADLLSKLIKPSKEETSYEDDKARKMKAEADVAQIQAKRMADGEQNSSVNVNIVIPEQEDNNGE
ncbi:terminase small subunit [Leuconostoc mesenteroides subsp. mesenteroides]|uniref:terminase small subunit n=1 Tax=Leuconostoc mesenteroides TaxID=1245 RepID=UPI000E09C24E|nr:terminase small subunit [Leuconostoc mesenteroides]RDF88665.1 terminase small subunit [Leuconostoc mesenteroides subsp. mesenteroides]